MNDNGTALATALDDPTNGALEAIETTQPYIAKVTIKGSAPIIFHRWNDEAVAAKSAAAKGSEAKKTDNVESYVYRNPEGEICLPGAYLVGSLIDPRNGAAKYRQDPRSPRKSALDLFRAGVVALTDLAPVRSIADLAAPAKVWDYLDSRRVMVQRSAVTRVRPTFLAGWEASVMLTVLTPEYISPDLLLDVLGAAGRLVGIGDYRPTFGRFQVTRFDLGFD